MQPRPDETAHTRAAIAEAAALAEYYGRRELSAQLARALEDVKRLEVLQVELASANDRLAEKLNAAH